MKRAWLAYLLVSLVCAHAARVSAGGTRRLLQAEEGEGEVAVAEGAEAEGESELAAAGEDDGSAGEEAAEAETDGEPATESDEDPSPTPYVPPYRRSHLDNIRAHFGETMTAVAAKHEEHFKPHMASLHSRTRQALTDTHQSIHGHVSKYVHHTFSPAIATIVTFALLFVPLMLVVAAFQRIRAILSLQKLLLFCNMYLTAFCITLMLITLLSHKDFNESLQQDSERNYVVLQFFEGMSYAVYLMLQLWQVGVLYKAEATSLFNSAMSELGLSVLVGVHYYMAVWRPAMMSHPPRTTWIIYLAYALIFAGFTLSTRLSRETRHEPKAPDLAVLLRGKGALRH
mmetsp:Transcript_19947/g.64939  ORF Transcript_19947/g.64939 Transcript_19947/m.64939 type:complete len:342 (-) Transcript_19947:1369-2394(-)